MTYDFGRHLTMLPSRGLRPAQCAPLTLRQSTHIYSNASRKVRALERLNYHAGARLRLRMPPRSYRHATMRAHLYGTAIMATYSTVILTNGL
jgi:hypothetical protein